MRVWIALLALAGVAHAGGEVGVAGGGDPMMQRQLVNYVEAWIEKHGYTVVHGPLSHDATNTLANCFVIDDLKCARGVVDLRTKTFNLLYASIDIDKKMMTIAVYWFVRGRDPAGEKQQCDACTAAQWHAVVDAMLARAVLATNVATGKLALHTDPPGLDVAIDDVNAGTSPLERELPAGKHTVTFSSEGKIVRTQNVDIASGQTSEVSITLAVARPPKRWLAPAALLGGGVLAGASGAIMIFVGTPEISSHKWIYPDLVPGGIALSVVGAAAIIGGAIWLATSRTPKPGPVATVGPGGGYIGWAGQF